MSLSLTSQMLLSLVALEHLYFLILEMFLWTHPYGRKIFGHTLEQSQQTAVLAKNQGLYNGFLAAGLMWSIIAPVSYNRALALFFLVCVLIAAVYGGITANRKIFFVQGTPATIALLSLFFIH